MVDIRTLLMPNFRLRKAVLVLFCLSTAVVISGCSTLRNLFLGADEAPPTPTEEVRVLVPTFTPTPEGAAPEPPPTVAEPAQVAVIPTNTPVPEAPTPVSEPATDTPVPAARLIVNSPANVRSGPGTTYGVVGAAEPNQAFDIVGKNAQGDWWQFCCVNGQQGWIFGQLVQVENAENVPVAQDIPAPPPPPTQPLPPPTNTPEPAAPPAPPPAADPCAGIGGDGCKFRVRNGPKFGGNGGHEIKLQLAFIHSGVDGGQAQGSYFIVLMKDGVKLPIGDHTRSIAHTKQNGQLGQYNYEYSLGTGDLPGNTITGHYEMWVLDGNGERDSQNIGFDVPAGQGLIWIEWDQG